MKKAIISCSLLSALILGGCGTKAPQGEPRVMARTVPERADDFIWENNLICYRAYGKALEKETISPGFDVWVKIPGALVADQRYYDALHNKRSYHKDWGNGMDCYKVGKSLGAGASTLLHDGKFLYPETNYRSYEIVEKTPEKISFVLHYPQWEADGESISLDKKITVVADSYFCKVEDAYTFSGELGNKLDMAAGILRHKVVSEKTWKDRTCIWEYASETRKPERDGFIGVAVCMPKVDEIAVSADGTHNICRKSVKSGKKVVYYVASCWSKGDIKTPEDWFAKVEEFKPF